MIVPSFVYLSLFDVWSQRYACVLVLKGTILSDVNSTSLLMISTWFLKQCTYNHFNLWWNSNCITAKISLFSLEDQGRRYSSREFTGSEFSQEK